MEFTLAELRAMPDTPKHWRIVGRNLVTDDGGGYVIPIESIEDSAAAALDWMRQLAEKRWVTTESLYDLANLVLYDIARKKR